MAETSNAEPRAPSRPDRQGVLASLGLGGRQARSWALYDWANSAFATTVMAAVLPIYYINVAGQGVDPKQASAYWGYTTAIALGFIALLSPILGAIADHLGAKKRFMGSFVALGVIFTASLWFVREGDWLMASGLFILANIGFAGANVFYDSLLAHVADEDRVDRLSATGFALGYLGGGILLVINAMWISSPERWGFADAGAASRAALVSVALWWAIYSVPLFRDVPEPETRDWAGLDAGGSNAILAGFTRLGRTFREIRQFPDLLVFLIAFLVYNDGIGTIIKLATSYGTTLGLSTGDLIGALILTQFAGIPFALLFGRLAERIGVKPGIMLSLVGYTLISVFAFFITQGWQFWVLALCVAVVQGGSQALSRSLYSSLVPRARSSEFFGFFSVSSKFAGIFGPLIYAVIIDLTGSSRLSILSLVVFFIVGMILLTRVDVARGQAAARAADLADSAESA